MKKKKDTKRRVSSLLPTLCGLLTMVGNLMLIAGVGAEEQSLSSNLSVNYPERYESPPCLPEDEYCYEPVVTDPFDLKVPQRNMMDLESGTYSTVGQELIIDLGDEIGIHTVFLLNNMMMSGDGNEYKNIYGSQIHVGSGSSFHSCDPVSGMIEDGGYFPLDSVTTDRYLSVRRPNCELDGDCSAWYDEYNG